jgi:hypothetical protein
MHDVGAAKGIFMFTKLLLWVFKLIRWLVLTEKKL